MKPDVSPAPSKEEILLEEIRDILNGLESCSSNNFSFYNLAIVLPKSTADICASASGFHRFRKPSDTTSKPHLSLIRLLTGTL